jgi:hypothetical protein
VASPGTAVAEPEEDVREAEGASDAGPVPVPAPLAAWPPADAPDSLPADVSAAAVGAAAVGGGGASAVEVGVAVGAAVLAAGRPAAELLPAEPLTACARISASEAAVGSEALTSVGAPAVLVAAEAVPVAPPEMPAAGRSGRRTSMYQAPAELGEASTRAAESHLACGREASPK